MELVSIVNKGRLSRRLRTPAARERIAIGKARRQARTSCGSSAVADCVLAAVVAGDVLTVSKVKKSFIIHREGDELPLARRRTKARAEQAIARVRELHALLAGAVCPPCAGGSSAAELERRRHTRVVTPQRPRGEPATYAVIDAAQLVASHDPHSFAPDGRYPSGVQEREYHRDKNEQRKVADGAQNLDPAFLLTDTPTAMDGPPLVTEGPPYLALGGNGRSMMIRRAYKAGEKGAQYRAALAARAADFGLLRDDVEKLEQPVLVRVVDGLNAGSDKGDLALAVRRYNEGLTQALSPRARAVAEAKSMRPETIAALGELLAAAGDASLRDLMRDKPRELVEMLARDGIITPQNRGTWASETGLTDEGKDRLEGMFLGRVVATGDRLVAMSPALVRKVERAVPHLLRVAGVNPELDLVPATQAAIDALNDAHARGMTLDQLERQPGLFAGAVKLEPVEKAVAELLESGTQRLVGDRFRLWATRAGVDPRQATMFFQPPTMDDALRMLVGATANTGRPSDLGKRIAEQALPGYRRQLEKIESEIGGRTGLVVAELERERQRLLRGIASAEAIVKANPKGRRPRAVNDGTAPPTRSTTSAPLRVTLQLVEQRADGNVFRPALARVDYSTGRASHVEAMGPASKTSLEGALTAARTLAKKLGLKLDVGGLLEDPGGKGRKVNPGAPCRRIPVISSSATTLEGLGADVCTATRGKLPKEGFLNTGGNLIRVNCGRNELLEARIGRRQLPALVKALAPFLARTRPRGVRSKRKESKPMRGAKKIKPEQSARTGRTPARAKRRRAPTLAEELAPHIAKLHASGERGQSAKEIDAELEASRRSPWDDVS